MGFQDQKMNLSLEKEYVVERSNLINLAFYKILENLLLITGQFQKRKVQEKKLKEDGFRHQN